MKKLITEDLPEPEVLNAVKEEVQMPRVQGPLVRKDIKWKQLPTGLYTLYFEAGGELPKWLGGCYTSIQKAQSDIAKYLAGKRE